VAGVLSLFQQIENGKWRMENDQRTGFILNFQLSIINFQLSTFNYQLKK